MSRVNIFFAVSGQRITQCADNPELHAGDRKHFYAVFDLEEAFLEVEPKAVFTKQGGSVLMDLVPREDGKYECVIPWEAMYTAGFFTIGIFGGDMMLTNALSVKVEKGCVPEGGAPLEPTPGWADQMNAKMNACLIALGEKVDKVKGKGLSTNDYTDIDKENVDEAARLIHDKANTMDLLRRSKGEDTTHIFSDSANAPFQTLRLFGKKTDYSAILRIEKPTIRIMGDNLFNIDAITNKPITLRSDDESIVTEIVNSNFEEYASGSTIRPSSGYTDPTGMYYVRNTAYIVKDSSTSQGKVVRTNGTPENLGRFGISGDYIQEHAPKNSDGIPYIDKVEITFDIKKPTKKALYFFITEDGTGTTPMSNSELMLWSGQDGTFQFAAHVDGADKKRAWKTGKYSTGQWIKMSLCFDFLEQTYDIFINDVYQATLKIPHSITGVGHMVLGTADEVYIDNMSVYVHDVLGYRDVPIANNGDGTLVAYKYPSSVGVPFKDLCPPVKVGDKIILEFETTSSTQKAWLSSGKYIVSGEAFIVEESDLEGDLCFCNNETEDFVLPATISNIKAMLFGVQTDSFNYAEPQEVTLDDITLRSFTKDGVMYRDEIVVDGRNKTATLIVSVNHEYSIGYDIPVKIDITNTESGKKLLGLHTNFIDTVWVSDAEAEFTYIADITTVYDNVLSEILGEYGELLQEFNNLKERVDGINLISSIEDGDAHGSIKSIGDSKAITEYSNAIGYNCVAGLKGYYWADINFETNQITLTTERPTDILNAPIPEKFTIDYKVGDELTIINSVEYPRCCKIVKISNNIITVDNLPFTSMVDLSDKMQEIYYYSIYCPDKPLVGGVLISANSHAEGYETKALAISTHTEGRETIALGQYSHAEGLITEAIGTSSHSEGSLTRSVGNSSHAEGLLSEAIGMAAHAEGYKTLAEGDYSHTEGYKSSATGASAHAEGQSTEASGNYSHAEGIKTIASGLAAHAEGQSTEASGLSAHAEGTSTKAIGKYSHAEGYKTLSEGNYSHAEGNNTKAIGAYSHAEGSESIAEGVLTHVEGWGTYASRRYQHVQGRFNIIDTHGKDSTAQGKWAHIVGNGTSDTARSNAHVLDWSGNAYYAGDVYVGDANDITNAKKLATEEQVEAVKTKVVSFLDGETLTLKDNTEYVSTADITNLTIIYPETPFISSISFALAGEGDITIILPNSKYIGEAPNFKNGEYWELNIKNGVVVGGKAA